MADHDEEMPDPSPVAPAPADEQPSTTGVVADDEAAEVDDG
ncbi:MAG: hypothetical protein ACLGIC_08935 [Acidimicrobiia bacterium]